MESKDRLNELDADRATLAERVTTPWWLAAGFGLIAATYIVAPAFDGRSAGVTIAALVISIALIATYQRTIGMKLGRVGGRAYLALAGGLVVLLGLYSVSLGLASLELRWWIAVPTAVAFAIGALLTVLFTTIARDRVRNAR